MADIRFTIYGRIPSKKNSKIIICRGNRPMLIPSKSHKYWHEEQSWKLKETKRIIKKPLDLCPIIYIDFYSPDSRRSDISNKVESIMDLLVDNEIIQDDNWFICPILVLRFCGIDKDNPRAEITITVPTKI